MATVADVARSAIAAVDSSAGLLLCSQWVAERYSQFIRRGHMRHMRTVREMTIPATITAGTVTWNSDTYKITPDDTAYAEMSNDIVGWHIRLGGGNTWYEIVDYSLTDQGGAIFAWTIRVASKITDDTTTTGTYELVKRYHALPDDVRWTTSFVHMQMQRELLTRTDEELNLIAPGRLVVGPSPEIVCESPRAVDGSKRIEFYPYSTDAATIHYVAWAIPPILNHDDNIPADVDASMLKEGTLIDIMRYEASQALKAGKADIAATLGNGARQQYTQWYGKDLPEAAAAERAFDDVQIILESMGGTRRGSARDVTTARDQIWSRGY